MKKCFKCGKENDAESKLCKNCGAELNAQKDTTAKEDAPIVEKTSTENEIPEKLKKYQEIMQSDTEKKDKKTSTIIKVITAVIIAILLILIAMFATKMLYIKDGNVQFQNIFDKQSQQVLDDTPIKNKDGEVQTKPNGEEVHKEPVIDKEGHYVVDENGNIVYKVPVVDENGNVKFDDKGNVEYKEDTTSPTKKEESTEATEKTTVPTTQKPTEKPTHKPTETPTQQPTTQSSGAKTVQVNGKDYKVGDTIMYTAYLGDMPKLVGGIDCSLVYNDDMLKIDADNIKFPILTGVVYNTDLKDQVLFNAVNIKGYDFCKRNIIVQVPFVVQESKSTACEIAISFRDIIDVNAKNLEVATLEEVVE